MRFEKNTLQLPSRLIILIVTHLNQSDRNCIWFKTQYNNWKYADVKTLLEAGNRKTIVHIQRNVEH